MASGTFFCLINFKILKCDFLDYVYHDNGDYEKHTTNKSDKIEFSGSSLTHSLKIKRGNMTENHHKRKKYTEITPPWLIRLKREYKPYHNQYQTAPRSRF